MENSYVRLHNITKVFGAVVANNGISLDVKKGEIHSILGENGSGKSTLMNILSGIYAQDSGDVYIAGKKVAITSPLAAQKLGIGMIHQHFKLVDVLSAKENIIGGIPNGVFIKSKGLTHEISDLCARYGLKVNPDRKVYQMAIGEKQSVEILKVLYRGANLLILDEPTAVLTPQETKKLFSILKKMRDEGCAILFISHKLNEVMELSDRVSVLRKGELIATLDIAEANPMLLTEMMVGKAIDLSVHAIKMDGCTKHPVLEVRNLHMKAGAHKFALHDISLDAYSHEILGIAGVSGSGQKELCEAIYGMQRPSAGSIRINGQDTTGLLPRQILKKGVTVGYIPEDRLGMGLAGGLDIVDNVILKSYYKTKGIFVNRDAGSAAAREMIANYQVNTPGISQVLRRLSGGNIQKVLLGREIELGPALLIAAYPVRGLDIGASHFVYEKLNEQKAKGVAIVYIGEDLDLLMGICDRIAVMCAGRMIGIVEPGAVTKEEIGLMMMGHKEDDIA